MFSLFINDLGNLLTATQLGLPLKEEIISCIFFADDLVIISKNEKSLDTLLDITRTYFKQHRLFISETKSKILSYNATTEEIQFRGTQSSSITLQQIISFKYLGIPINSKPYCLFKDFNEQAKRRAKQYMASILSLVKSGPDRADLAYTIWTSCAIPAILYGAEVIPLTQGTINEIEACQSKVGKFILQTPKNSADVTVNIDAGLKPVWSIIAEKVHLYAARTLKREASFWPRMAIAMSLDIGYSSPYTRNLLKWKEKVNTNLLSITHIKGACNRAAIQSVLRDKDDHPSTFAMNPPGSTSSNRWFRRKSWISDSCLSKVICLFRSCNANLGNRGPTKDGRFYKFCPLCLPNGVEVENNEVIKIN